jgi:hypothetical protein
MEYTLSFSETQKGWASFYSFVPEFMVGMNNKFYSFKGGNLFVHDSNAVRNNFYGTQYSSKIKTVINDQALENKLFKALELQSSDAWGVLMTTDIQDTGFIQSDWFQKRESSFFAYIRNSGTLPMGSGEYPLRSVSGIGRSTSINTVGYVVTITFPILIGNIISVNDYVYFAVAPYSSPQLCGVVTTVGLTSIVINTNITHAVTIGSNPYFLYVKNSVSESSGILGHYATIELENTNTNRIELFAVESEVQKSY